MGTTWAEAARVQPQPQPRQLLAWCPSQAGPLPPSFGRDLPALESVPPQGLQGASPQTCSSPNVNLPA